MAKVKKQKYEVTNAGMRRRDENNKPQPVKIGEIVELTEDEYKAVRTKVRPVVSSDSNNEASDAAVKAAEAKAAEAEKATEAAEAKAAEAEKATEAAEAKAAEAATEVAELKKQLKAEKAKVTKLEKASKAPAAAPGTGGK